jgi:hypothetical protein
MTSMLIAMGASAHADNRPMHCVQAVPPADNDKAVLWNVDRGTVRGSLNVREKPNAKSKILFTIPAASILISSDSDPSLDLFKDWIYVEGSLFVITDDNDGSVDVVEEPNPYGWVARKWVTSIACPERTPEVTPVGDAGQLPTIGNPYPESKMPKWLQGR